MQMALARRQWEQQQLQRGRGNGMAFPPRGLEQQQQQPAWNAASSAVPPPHAPPQQQQQQRPPPPLEQQMDHLRREALNAAAGAAAQAAARAVESATRAVGAQFAASTDAARLEAQASAQRIERRLETLERQAGFNNDPSRVVAATREAAVVAFREAMAASLAPAIEAATRACFQQMDAALRDRLRVHDDMEQDRLKRFDAMWGSLRTQVDDLKARLDDLKVSNHRDPDDDDDEDEPSSPPAAKAKKPEEKKRDVREDIAEAIDAKDFDGAVYKAVECDDVSVLLFAVDRIGVANASTSATPFQQLTLLCLIQQLGTTITRADHLIPIKLEWIEFAVLGLDPSDPQIISHVPPVLKQVKAALESLPANLSGPKVKILIHIINSLLK